MQGRATGLPEHVNPEKSGDEGGQGNQGAGRKRGSREEAIIEISDEDYRSFCLPCYTMEGESDCKQGK